MKRPLFILLILFSSIQVILAQCYCEDCPEPIIFGMPSTASLNVSGASNFTLGQNGQSLINVGVQFTHDAAQELSLRIVAPNGSFVDLTIGEGLNAGQNNNFDIDFVQCTDAAMPDCTNNSTWTSIDEWDEGPYTGTYFPESGCLEDLTGDMNGAWVLEMEDVFGVFDGELFCFDLTFADDAGVSCNNASCDDVLCLAQGGNNTMPASVTAPEGDPSLVIDFNVTYGNCEFPPSEPEYVFVYVIYEPFPGTIVDIVEGTVDMTAYSEGTYIVQGLSILASDLPTIQALDFNTTTYFDLALLFQNGTICADNTFNTSTVTIVGCLLVIEIILPFEIITAPAGDPALDPDWISTITYVPNIPPDPAIYGFYFVVYDAITEILIGYFTTDDFTSLPEGNYNVTYLVYLLSDAALLPLIDGTNTILDLVSMVLNQDICAVVSAFNSLMIGDFCMANAGVLPIAPIDECVGDPSLNLDLTPSYPGGDEPDVQYSYTYVISENGVITGYDMSTDFTSYPAGEYEVCGLSYLTSDEPLIPAIDGSYSLGDLQIDIDNEVFCADITDDCQTVIINEVPAPIFTGPTEVCAGVLVQYVVENFSGDDSDYLFFIQQGGFSTLNNNGDGTFDITWIFGPGVICLTENSGGCSEQVCITVNIIPQPEFTITGAVTVCPGDELIYTFDPAPIGAQFYDVFVTGGSISSQTSNTVTILWDDSSQGSIEATLLGGVCDSETVLLEIDKVSVEFPMLSIPANSCFNEGLTIPDITDPDITNWNWTATNADIFINLGMVNFTWQDIGPGEICLEIFSVCGQEQQCFPFDILEAPEPSSELDIEVCSFTFTLEGIPSNGTSWLWSAPGLENCVIISDPTNLVTEVTATCGPGVYLFMLQEFTADCMGSVQVPVTVTDGLEVTGPFFDCDLNGFYTVNFTIENGNQPYLVNGITIGSNVFSSALIASGTPYSFTVIDDDGCEVVLEGSHECPCITDAGTMDTDLLFVCISSDEELQGIHNGDQIFDADDVGTYILHTSFSGNLGTVIAENNTGSFGFDEFNMVAGQTYYISFVAGDPFGSGVNLTDPCLSVSVGQPIIFYDDPAVDAGEDDTSCELLYNLTSNAITLEGDWSVVDQPIGSIVDFQVISGETFATVDMSGDYTFLLAFSEEGCLGSDEVIITFIDSPTVTNISTECDGDFYTVSFDVTGGTEPYFVNGNEILDDTYTTAPIMSGENYGFTIIDAEGCISDFIQGTEVCNCITDAGTMSQEEITICAVVGELITATFNNDATLDSNDKGIFIMHMGSSNILGSIYATSDTPEFEYTTSFGSTFGPDVMHYISYVVADELGAIINYNDECLSVSIGQPVIILKVKNVEAGEYSDMCDYSFNLNADDKEIAGSWSVVDAPTDAIIGFDNEIDAQSLFETNLPGTYSLAWSPSNYLCANPDTTTFELDSILVLDSKIVSCADDLSTYTIDVSISGGQEPYFLDGVQTSSTFTSASILSGDSYSFLLIDARGCELLIEGTATCDCSNSGGSMALDTLRGCVGDTLIATYNNDAVLDTNDVEFFVLHTSSDNTLGAVFAISTEPIVVYVPGLIIGNVYYLSHIIGNQLGGGLDYNDPCLQISMGQPVQFVDPPEVSAGDDQEICGLTAFLNGSSLESPMIWSVIQTPFGAIVNVDENDPVSELTVDVSGEYILEIEANNGFCSAYDTVSITFIETIYYEDLSINCTIDGFTVSFNIFGGSGSYLVDGNVLSGNSFESALIPSGETFIFTLTDSGNCPAIEVDGLDTCECENDAGTMQEELIEICIDMYIDINALSNNDVILDDDDIRYVVIHTSPTDELGDTIAVYVYIGPGVSEWGFVYSPFEIGVTYYVSTVLADMGVIYGDAEDPCMKVAEGTPIVWKDYNEISFNDDLDACIGDIVNIDLTASGELPFEITIIDNLGYSEMFLIEDENFSFEYVVTGEAILSFDSDIEAMCFSIEKNELIINIEELQIAEIQETITICNGEEFGSIVYLENLLISGNTDGRWFFDGNEIQDSFDFNGFVEGEYKIEYLIESMSCSLSEIYEVTVEVRDCDCPMFDFTSENVTCFGDQDGSISILIGDGLDIGDFVMFLNEEEIESTIEIGDLASDAYTLEISDGNDCVESFDITITEPAPVQISLGDDMEVQIDDPVIIEAITNLIDQEIDGVTWESLSGILEDNDLLLNTSFQSDDMISIHIVDENGCSGTDEIMVRVTFSDFVIPNVMNTNSTAGNDVFKIHNTNGIDEIVSLSIYDRWGNVVHRVQNISPDSDLAEWDGTFGGRELNPGVYIYRIVLLVRGEEKVVFGDLTLL